MALRNTYYLSEFGGVGGNLASDTAAALRWKAKLRHKGIRLVVDKPTGNQNAWAINQDLMWGLNGSVQGGIVEMEWHLGHTVRQTIMDYCTIRAASEIIGNPNTAGIQYKGPAFVAYGDTSGFTWVAPGATTDLWNKAAWRIGDTHGKVVTAARFEGMLFFKQNGANRVGAIETCGIGVYGDGLQENAGLEKCIFQGFRQPVSLPYAPSTSAPAGRNANFHLIGNNFNGPGPAITDTSGAAGAGTTIPLAGLGTVNGFAGLNRTLALEVGDYLGVVTSAGWETGVVTAVTPGTSCEIWPATVGTISGGALVHHMSVNVDAYGGAGCMITRNTAVHASASTTRPVAPNFRIAGEIDLQDFHTEHGSAAVEIGGMVLQNDGNFGGVTSGATSKTRIGFGSLNTVNFGTTYESNFIQKPARSAAIDAAFPVPATSRPSYPAHGITIDGPLKDGADTLTNWLKIGLDSVIDQKAVTYPCGTNGPRVLAGPIIFDEYNYDAGNGLTYGPSIHIGARCATRNMTLNGTYNLLDRLRARHIRVTLGGSTDINSIADCQEGDELFITLLSAGTLRLMQNTGTGDGAGGNDGRIWPHGGNYTMSQNQTVRLVGIWTPSNVRGWAVFPGV